MREENMRGFNTWVQRCGVELCLCFTILITLEYYYFLWLCTTMLHIPAQVKWTCEGHRCELLHLWTQWPRDIRFRSGSVTSLQSFQPLVPATPRSLHHHELARSERETSITLVHLQYEWIMNFDASFHLIIPTLFRGSFVCQACLRCSTQSNQSLTKGNSVLIHGRCQQHLQKTAWTT